MTDWRQVLALRCMMQHVLEAERGPDLDAFWLDIGSYAGDGSLRDVISRYREYALGWRGAAD